MNPTWWIHTAPEAGLFLLEMALKSALLIAGLLLADRLLGDRRASWRNLLWIASLVGLILIPLASAWGPALRVPVFAEGEPMVAAVQSHPLALEVPEGTGTPLQADPPASLPGVVKVTEPRAVTWGWASSLVLVYGVGVCFFLGRLGLGLLYVSSLRRHSQEVRDTRLWPVLQELRVRLGIRRAVLLGTSEKVGSPLQIGVFSPMAILPSRLVDRLDDQTFRAVAAHELAHIRRWDYLIHVLAMVVLAFHWFNPLAWLAVRRLRQTGEHACDEWAVRLIGRYEVYARALLDVLGDMRGQRLRWGLGMAYQAEERLERIMAMRNAVPAGVGRWMGGAVVGFLSSGAILLGCSRLAADQHSGVAGTGQTGIPETATSNTRVAGGGRIAYFLTGSAEAHTVNVDGTSSERLANLQVGDFVVWAGDGKRVAFVDRRHGSDICVMPSDGAYPADVIHVTNDVFVEQDPSLSHDGSKVAFYRYDPSRVNTVKLDGRDVVMERGEICVTETDGTEIVSLTEQPEVKDLLPEVPILRAPAISPDGRWVAFTSLYLKEKKSEILIVNTQTGDARRLLRTPFPEHGGSPSWSPDGTQLAFSDTKDIYVVNMDGTNLHQVTHLDNLHFMNQAMWSPDGTQLAMQGTTFANENAWKNHTGESDIWAMDVDGANLHQVTVAKNAVTPRWVSVGDR